MATITTINNGDTGLVARTSINDNFTNLNTDKLETSLKGANNGLAELDGSGLVPASQLPASDVTSVFTRSGAVTAANGDYTASQVTNTPAGSVAAITVQAAIDELDSEKEPASAILSSLASQTVTTSNRYFYSDGVDSFTMNTISDDAIELLNDPTYANMRNTLGSGAVGDAVFVSATEAAAQQAMSVEVNVDVPSLNVPINFIPIVTNITPVLTDNGKLLVPTAAAAKTVTIPPNASVAYPIGATIAFKQDSVNPITFAPGAGVSIQSYSGLLDTAGQYAMATIVQESINVWVLSGNLA